MTRRWIDDEIALGALMREYRQAAGLSQATVAAGLGCAQTVISRMESGSYGIDVPTFTRWCAILNVPTAMVLRELGQELLPDGTEAPA